MNRAKKGFLAIIFAAAAVVTACAPEGPKPSPDEFKAAAQETLATYGYKGALYVETEQNEWTAQGRGYYFKYQAGGDKNNRLYARCTQLDTSSPKVTCTLLTTLR